MRTEIFPHLRGNSAKNRHREGTDSPRWPPARARETGKGWGNALRDAGESPPLSTMPRAGSPSGRPSSWRRREAAAPSLRKQPPPPYALGGIAAPRLAEYVTDLSAVKGCHGHGRPRGNCLTARPWPPEGWPYRRVREGCPPGEVMPLAGWVMAAGFPPVPMDFRGLGNACPSERVGIPSRMA